MTTRADEGIEAPPGNTFRPSSLDAYREDLAGGEWQQPTPFLTEAIEIAAMLQAATSLPTSDAMVVVGRCAGRARGMLVGETSPEWSYDPAGSNAPTGALRVLSREVMNRGHRRLATHLLRSLSLLYPAESVEGARILMSLVVDSWEDGEEEMSRAMTNRLFVIARRLGRDDLKFAAWTAFAYLAYARGNLPRYGRAVTRIMKYAERSGNSRLLATAHDRLAVYFGNRGDLATGLVHHWQATSIDDHPDVRQTYLLNTATTLFLMGQFAAARAARAAGLTYRMHSGIAMVNLGGYSECCAALGDRDGVRWAATQALSLAERSNSMLSIASGLLDCAGACGQMGLKELAAELFARGMGIAEAKGYHQLRFQRDPTTPSSPNAVPLRLAGAAEDALRSIKGLAPDGVSMDLKLVAN